MQNDNIIEIKNVKKVYGNLVVCEDLSFDIKRGEICSIVGGSGCGKSTILRQIVGLESPTEGTILINKIDINKINKKEDLELKKKYGVLFQSGGLFASMTLAENIAIVIEKYTDLDENTISKLVDLKLGVVGLSGFQSYLPSEISGGMKKRAALARAMALDPQILFFDEPSSGLDPITSVEMDNLILELNKSLGTTMVIISHDLQSILDISDHIIMLDKSTKGKIAEGKPEELKSKKDNPIVFNFFNRSISHKL